ncbi:MAG: hypothetical protein QOG42_1730 [Solirubrobacteraceae bacterium]|nr:hypothetical protein [Solirubrobacteraceae bacterium]
MLTPKVTEISRLSPHRHGAAPSGPRADRAPASPPAGVAAVAGGS